MVNYLLIFKPILFYYLCYTGPVKKFIKPVSIFFVVLAVLGAGILIGEFALGKNSDKKPEVLKIATKSTGKDLAIETEKLPTQVEQPKENPQQPTSPKRETKSQSTTPVPTPPKTSNVVEKPAENTAPLPTIPASPPVEESLPFTEAEFNATLALLDEINALNDQLDSIYQQLLALEDKYYKLPDVIHTQCQGYCNASQAALKLAAEQEKVINQYNQKVSEYNQVEYNRDKKKYQLCTTYFSVLYYYGYTSYCN